MKKFDIAFFSTSEFGYSVLKYLNKNFNVRYVVSSYPKPRGRGQKIKDLEFVNYAKNNNIEVIYVDSKDELMLKIDEWHFKNGKIDFAIVVDFKYILHSKLFEFAKYYFINIHPSLLPKYRGPSPIQFTLLNNEPITGITIQKMVRKVDSGDILIQKIIPVDEDENFNSLYHKLEKLSIIAIKDFFENFENIEPLNQLEEFSSYSKKIRKEDAIVNFDINSNIISGKINAFSNWPKVKVNFIKNKLILINSMYYDFLLNKEKNEINYKIQNLDKKVNGEIIDIKDIEVIKFDFTAGDNNVLTLNTFNKMLTNIQKTNSLIDKNLISIDTYRYIIKEKDRNKILKFVKNRFKYKVIKRKAICVKCNNGMLFILTLQKIGKRRLDVNDFIMGFRQNIIGNIFS